MAARQPVLVLISEDPRVSHRAGDDIAKFRAALKKLGVSFHVEKDAAPAEASWNADGHPVAPITPDGIAALVAKAQRYLVF